MTRTYEHKFMGDGVTPNPKYKPDIRKGDRHKSSDDRHRNDGNRHGSRYRSKFIAIHGEGITTDTIVGYVTPRSGPRLPAFMKREHVPDIPIYEHKYVLLMA